MSSQIFRKNFSQRNGFISIPAPLDPEELPDQLRIEFEDLLTRECIEGSRMYQFGSKRADWNRILEDYLVQFFGQRRFPGSQYHCIEKIFSLIQVGDFHEVFTVMEDLAFKVGDSQPSFQKEINDALIRNQAPYLLQNSSTLGWGIIQTGTYEEQKAVISAFQDLTGLDLAIPRQHFEKAGRHLAKENEESDVVRESTMGLEALLKIYTHKHNVSLGSILQTEQISLEIPPPINDILKGIWKYRSEAPGVGHSHKPISSCPRPSRWEAQLLYVFCCGAASYFINKNRHK